mgnify:CR=1 FL=1
MKRRNGSFHAALASVGPELWLALRRPNVGPATLFWAGALVAPGSALATRLFAPTVLSGGLLAPTLVSGALGGGLVGALTALALSSVHRRHANGADR